ncbi:MAG: hypothetical protein HDT46_11080 [Ruminococcaceae bacterium]|nr:hypothetical protein [Oscillospiraceae bacterium]
MLKGLILKDLYSIKFQLIMGIMICAFPSFLLFCMTVGYADGEGLPNSEWFVTLCYVMVNYSTIAICSSVFVNTVSEDVSCGWLKMAGTMPLSPRMICLGKIASSAVVLVILTVVTSLCNVFGVAMGVGNAEVLIATPICTMLLQMAVLSPVFPFALRFGGNKASPFYICVLIGATVLMAAAIYICFENGVAEAVRIVFYGVVPAAAVVSVAGSVGCSRRMLGV